MEELKKSHKKRNIIIALVVIAIVAVIGIVGYQSTKNKKSAGEEYTTEPLAKHSIVSSVSGTGTVKAQDSEEVISEISGYKVKEVLVEEGDMVSAGDIICILDVSDVEEQRNETAENRAEAVADKKEQDADYDKQLSDNQTDREERLQAAKETRDEKKAAYKSAKADYDSYRAQYDTEKNALISQGYSESSAEAQLSSMAATLQQKKTTLDTAKAEYESAQSQVDAIKAENDDTITDAKENYDDTQQDAIDTYDDTLEDLDETIENAVIRTTISGAVTELNVEEGRTFNGTTVALVEGISDFYVEASIDEYDVADVEKGMSFVMKTDATRDEQLTGVVTYVALKASESSSSASALGDYSSLLGGDLSSSFTGSSSANDATFTVKISLDEENERLRLGMNVQVSIITEEADDVLAVPYDAIQEREDGTTYIEVIDEANSTTDENGNTVQATKEIDVTVGLEGAYYSEVISDELVEGLEVVIPSDDSDQSVDELLNMVGNAGGV